MVIVVVTHDAGWRYHVVVEHELVTVGRAHDNDVVLPFTELPDHHAPLVARDVTERVRFGEYTLALEHHHEPVEAALLAAIRGGDDQSRVVYADWLDEHGFTSHAAFLRTQLAIVRCGVDDPNFAVMADRLRALIPALPYGWCSHLEQPVIELGDPADFALHVGLVHAGHPIQRTVKLWAAGIELTCDDDSVHVPSFSYSIAHAIAQVEMRHPVPFPELDLIENHRRLEAGNDHRDRHRWLDCGPTTDNIAAFLFHADGHALVTFQFWRPQHPRPHELGQVFVARIADTVLTDGCACSTASCASRSASAAATSGSWKKVRHIRGWRDATSMMPMTHSLLPGGTP